MRRFYLVYSDRLRISQTPSAISERSDKAPISQTPSAYSRERPFALSWSHQVFVIGVSDPDERAFYEVEAVSSGWSLAEQRRQFDTSLYERLALSRDK